MVVVVQCEIKPRGSTAYAPLPGPNQKITATRPQTSLPEGSISQEVNAVKSLEHCLVNCDQMDIQIIKGLLQGTSVEKIAEDQYISVGTARYRLKKMYPENQSLSPCLSATLATIRFLMTIWATSENLIYKRKTGFHYTEAGLCIIIFLLYHILLFRQYKNYLHITRL